MVGRVSAQHARKFHLVNSGKEVVAFHTPSLNVFTLSPLVAEIIRRRSRNENELDISSQLSDQGYPKNLIEEGFRAIEKLGDDQSLNDALPLSPPKTDLHPRVMCLNIAHTCNMACRYCFAGDGSYGGRSSKMDERTIEQAVDWMLKSCPDSEFAHIQFFGGEPLMNAAGIRHAVSYAESQAEDYGRRVVFGIVTNATLISDDIAEFLAAHKFVCELSIDGPPDIQNYQRPLRRNRASSESAFEGARRLLKASTIPVHARATITPHSPSLIEIFDYFTDFGFPYIHLIPATCASDPTLHLSDKQWEMYLDDLQVLFGRMVDQMQRGIEFPRLGNLDELLHKIHRKSQTKDCGVGKELASVTPQGDIYPCPRFVNEPHYLLGNVATGLIKGAADDFLNRSTSNMSHCAFCWARHYCHGGCAYEWWAMNHDIKRPTNDSCERLKQLIDLALVTYAKAAHYL
jgi:uncharacterized protein